MSFGFSVGDFVAVIKLANDIRKEFADAPEQFRQINAEIRNLAIVLGDVDVSLAAHDVSEDQNKNLDEIRESCRRVLEDSRKELSKYSNLDSSLSPNQENFRGRAKRLWERVKWEPDDVRDLRSRIASNITALNSFTGANIRNTVFKLEERQVQQEHQQIFEWLTPLDTTVQQSDFIRQRQAGTGQWLINSTEYVEWKATKGGVVFFHGIPGAGKTILSSIVVEDLQDTFGVGADVAIAYFFCNFKSQGGQTVENVLLSFLKQLSQSSNTVPDVVQALFDQCQSRRRRPRREEITRTLCSVVPSFARTLIVVDALDECQTSNGCQRELISHLLELQRIAGVNILATSRPVPHIAEMFNEFSSLEIRASEEDIHRYVDNNLLNLPGFVSRDKKLQEEIKEGVAKTVDGIYVCAFCSLSLFIVQTLFFPYLWEFPKTINAIRFLLAKLHLDSVREARSPRALKKTLSTLATGNDAYDEAYRNTMQRISEQLQKEIGMQTLMWIVHAKRPLTTIELQHALGVEVGEREFFRDNLPDLDDMVSACCGLVVIDDDSHMIRLIHYTTQEFFERRGNQYFPEAEAHITDTCVTYLAFDVFGTGICHENGDFTRRLTEFPLYGYSSQYWGQHAKTQANATIIGDLLALPKQIEACGQALIMLETPKDSSGFYSNYMGPSQMTGLHLAAYFGLVGIICSTLDIFPNPDIQDSRRRTPLWYAALKDSQDVVRQLLDRDCQPDIEDEHHQTPLKVAVRSGHEAVVRMLLDKDAQVNPTDDLSWTPLLWAVSKGNEAIVRLLLDKGAEVNYADSGGWNPLLQAAKSGHEAIVRLLLEKDAEVNHADCFGRTPLVEATQNSHDAIVQLLLEKGVQVNHADDDGQTPLFQAARHGQEVITRLLVDGGAQIDHADNDGRTPLCQAVRSSHTAVVSSLLEKGARVDHLDNVGKTPLLLVDGNNREAIIRLLLDKGAQINYKDYWGWSPLRRAAAYGQDDIVTLLLKYGADINMFSRTGQTPLYMACCSGHTRVAEILIDHGARVNFRTSGGSTPLVTAAKRGNWQIAELLLAAGADYQASDIYGRSVLVNAITSNQLQAVDLILAQGGFDPNVRDYWGSAAISFAVRYGNIAIFRKIASLSNTDILAQDVFGRTTLWWAYKRGHKVIAQEIIEHQRAMDQDTKEISIPQWVGKHVTMFSFSSLSNGTSCCDVCMAVLHDFWFHCISCVNGDFDVCQECYSLGARCLISSHRLLIKRDGIIY